MADETVQKDVIGKSQQTAGPAQGDLSVVQGNQQFSLGNASVDVPKLRGSNYLNWKSMMEDLLELRGLSGSIKESFGLDRVKNLQAKLLIKSTLDEVHLEAVRSLEFAHQVWNKLSNMCVGTNSSDVTTLVNKFYSYEYRNGDSVSTHLEKLTTMRSQLELVQQNPTDLVFIDRILKTLPAQYKKLKENWEFLHPTQQTVTELKTRAIKLEDELKTNDLKPTSQAFIAEQRSSRRPNKYKSLADKKKNSTCNKCGLIGHWARECHTKPENYLKRQDNVRQNVQQQSKDRNFSFAMDNQSCLSSGSQINSHGQLPLKELWIADSGATAHMCNHEEWFTCLNKYKSPHTVCVGDNRKIAVLGTGEVEVISEVDGSQITGTIKNVLLVPDLATNLLSIGHINDQDVRAVFSSKQVRLLKDKTILAEGTKWENNLYLMNMIAAKAKTSVALYSQAQRSIEDWHQTLGHANKNRILKLHRDQAIKVSNPTSEPNCPDCPPGKGRHVSHPSRNHKATSVGELVYVDLGGPVTIPSIGGYNYYMLCKDEWSSYTYGYLLEDKSKTTITLAKFLAEFEADTSCKVKRLQTDMGSEFVNKRCEVLFALERVVHITTAPYTPQQNGAVEREMQTITDMARTMLEASRMDRKLWDEAIKTAVFIKNRLPTANNDRSPYELAIQQKPKLDHLCSFGTQVHILVDGHYLTKFDPRTEPGYIVGFTKRSNTYRVYLERSQRVTESCNVIFRAHKQPVPTEQHRDGIGASTKANFEWSSTKPSTSQEPRNANSSLLSDFFRGYLKPQNSDETEFEDALECSAIR